MAKKKKTNIKPITQPFTVAGIVGRALGAPGGEAAHNDLLDADRASRGIVRSQQPPRGHESPQLLMDQHHAKTEKEALKMIGALKQARQTSEYLPQVDIDLGTRDHILTMIMKAEPPPKRIREPQDQVLPRLALAYGILRGLDFPDTSIKECLRAIPDFDLDSAMEWLYLNCQEYELNLDNRLKNTALGSGTPPVYGATPIVERTREVSPSTTPASSLPTLSAMIVGLDLEGENVSVNIRWARIKVALHMLKFGKPESFQIDLSDPQVQKQESELQALELDHKFRRKHAEDAFQELREIAEADELERMLRTPITANNPLQPDNRMSNTHQAQGPSPTTVPFGPVAPVYKLEFPRNWNGATPKLLLKGYVTKLDRDAIISYRSIDGATRVARAAVQIRWRGKPGQEWIIPAACPTLTQAKHYAAILALHSLASPVRAGFVGLRSTITPVKYSGLRSLPRSAQDLWKELEVRRKMDEDRINRCVWSDLQTILEPRLFSPNIFLSQTSNSRGDSALPMNVISRIRTATTEPSATLRIRCPAPPKELGNLKAYFEGRRSSPAYQAMLLNRNKLPIAAFKSQILECLNAHQVIVLNGKPGCGKSTQLPAYILEDQLSRGLACKICCTEPWRISATCLAQRVSRELGEPPNAVGTSSSLIGYSVHLEKKVTGNTRLTFVTNDIALRMLEGGDGSDRKRTAFDEITHIIIDEVQERSIESDVLLIVLRSMLHQRPDLKIVLMSAAADAGKISAYFGGPSLCPVLVVSDRTFPVKVRFLEDAIELTQWKICKDQPHAIKGNGVSRRKKTKLSEWPLLEFPEETAPAEDDDEDGEPSTAPVELGKQYSVPTISTIKQLDERRIPYELILRLLEKICLKGSAHSRYSTAILVFMPGLNEVRQLTEMLGRHHNFGTRAFRIYPLHSTLLSESQTMMFETPLPGVTKIVISTHIAEAGITIPDITCVIDTGKHKEMRFDEKRQTNRLIETTIARSNAAQRRGRAGRVQEGLCFHLFTKSCHDNLMMNNPLPEMLRLSLTNIALRIKTNPQIGNSVEDVLSRALDPPSSANIQRAVNVLIETKALTTSEQITDLGRLLVKLPMDVHLGKFLLYSVLLGCLDTALTICAALNAKSPFLRPFGFESQARAAKASFAKENSDFLTLQNAFTGWKRALVNGQHAAKRFCRESYLSYQNLQEIEDLRQQYMGYLIDSSCVSVDSGFYQEFKRIRFHEQRVESMNLPKSLGGSSNDDIGLIQAALTAGMFPQIISIDPSSGKMQTISNNGTVAFHPSSVNFRRGTRKFSSTYLCYSSLMYTRGQNSCTT